MIASDMVPSDIWYLGIDIYETLLLNLVVSMYGQLEDLDVASNISFQKKSLEAALDRTRQKLSQVAESLLSYSEIYFEYDPLLNCPQPSNPWHSDEITYWVLNEAM